MSATEGSPPAHGRTPRFPWLSLEWGGGFLFAHLWRLEVYARPSSRPGAWFVLRERGSVGMAKERYCVTIARVLPAGGAA